MAVQAAEPKQRAPEEQWPAIPLAYDLAVKPSYEIMLKRFEIHENRVRGLITLAASLTFGAPVFAKAARGDLPYSSPWLLAALGCAAFILVLGTLAFVGRRVTTLEPSLVHEGALDAECRRPWDFEHWALARAGEAWAENRRRLEWKGRVSDSIAVILLVELACMVAWILFG